MPLSSAGVLTRLYNWVTDRDGGLKILADRMDKEFDGIVSAFNALTSGAVNLRGALRNILGTVTNPAYSFVDDPNTGVYRHADDVLGLTGGNDVLLVGNGGLTVNGRVLTGADGFIAARAPTSDTASVGFVIFNDAGTEVGRLSWVRSTGEIALRAGGTSGHQFRVTADGTITLNGYAFQSIVDSIGREVIGPQSLMLKCDQAIGAKEQVSGSKLHYAGFNSDGTTVANTATLPGAYEARGRCGAGGITSFIRIA